MTTLRRQPTPLSRRQTPFTICRSVRLSTSKMTTEFLSCQLIQIFEVEKNGSRRILHQSVFSWRQIRECNSLLWMLLSCFDVTFINNFVNFPLWFFYLSSNLWTIQKSQSSERYLQICLENNLHRNSFLRSKKKFIC